MKEKILALLLTAFTGVRKDGLTQLARSLALQVATEEEAKALIEKLTKEQVDNFVKEFRGEVDKEVTDGNKTYETNLKKKYDFVEKKSEPGKDPDPANPYPTNFQEIIEAAVTKAVKPFKEKLAGFEQGNIAKSRLQQLTDKLSSCKDEVFKTKVLKDFSRMKFETDEEFTEYLTDTQTDVNTANQKVSDSALGAQGQPFFTTAPASGKEASEAEISAIMDKLPI